MTPAVLLLALAVAAPAAKEPPKKDPPSLVGEWVVENAIENGKLDNPPPGTTWTFTADGKSVLKVGPPVGAALDGTYTTDPKRAPAQVDVLAGPGETLRGIYRVEKDTLTFCYTEGKVDRPTAFDSPAGSKVVLLTLARVKPKD